jgi:fused signal recognition particle receptor
VREKLATAREEAETTITAEAQETERLRAELRAAREETERTLETERAETAKLREELATEAGDGNGDDAEATAARRMYERIARELERERAAARSLRRELDAVQAQTAEPRRASSAAAANGITDDSPAAATPAGRLVAARRTEAGRAAAHHRAEAARAAAAQRVPHGHRSPAAVWAIRGAALVFVAALLVALVLIVSWVGLT